MKKIMISQLIQLLVHQNIQTYILKMFAKHKKKNIFRIQHQQYIQHRKEESGNISH